MNAQQTLAISREHQLAYHRLEAERDGATLPGVIFLGGFNSDMTGVKATWLQEWAAQRGRAFVRFDYRGHGASSGAFTDGSISAWVADASHILMHLSHGPQILVGSSMGGWIALLLALRHPDRIKGLIGIAAAPDFTADKIEVALSAEQQRQLDDNGFFTRPSAYSTEPYVITKRLIEDGRKNLVLRNPLKLNCVVRLLHGTADEDVDPNVAVRLINHLDCQNAQLTLIKGSDHRFSGPEELGMIGAALGQVTAALLE